MRSYSSDPAFHRPSGIQASESNGPLKNDKVVFLNDRPNLADGIVQRPSIEGDRVRRKYGVRLLAPSVGAQILNSIRLKKWVTISMVVLFPAFGLPAAVRSGHICLTNSVARSCSSLSFGRRSSFSLSRRSWLRSYGQVVQFSWTYGVTAERRVRRRCEFGWPGQSGAMRSRGERSARNRSSPNPWNSYHVPFGTTRRTCMPCEVIDRCVTPSLDLEPAAAQLLSAAARRSGERSDPAQRRSTPIRRLARPHALARYPRMQSRVC